MKDLPILPGSLKINLDFFYEKDNNWSRHEVMLLADKMAIFDLEDGNIMDGVWYYKIQDCQTN
jgi:hypothetical protein